MPAYDYKCNTCDLTMTILRGITEDELKLAGNGVVPQQAELALRLLLELPEIRDR